MKISGLSKTEQLAVDRTKLANQRTFLAFIRTFFTFTGAGVSALTMDIFEELRWLGYAFIITSTLVMIFGTIDFIRTKRYLRLMVESANE